jgi:glycosyltransferase involved in cell wall biosynthesis
MRIAVIATAPVPSRRANSLQVMKTCASFVQLGHAVHLFVPGRSSGATAEEISGHYGVGVTFPITWLPAWRPLRSYDFAIRSVSAARRWQADLMFVRPLQAAALAARLGYPTLLDLHDRPHGHLGPRLFRLFLGGKGARRLITTTRALREWLQRELGVQLPDSFARVAPNGVDLERYNELPLTPEARRRLGLPERFTASYTGQLYAGRGLDLLMELARRHPEFGFAWAGGDPEAVERWRMRLSEAAIGNTILLGFVPNERLPLLHAASDVLLMPYEERVYLSGGNLSTFYSPMKLFEYLASERAILSSDLPVLHEVLNDENAILLPPEDIGAWDGALTAIAHDDERRLRLARQARRDASRYTWTARAHTSLEGLEP